MAKARTDDPARAIDDLHDAVERLNQRVEVLTEAIDELHDEVQWRNNERRGSRDTPSSPFVLHSMPADPTTDDWQLNRVSAEQVEAIRNSLTPPAEIAASQTPSVQDRSGQAPDLRQIVATFILLSSESFAAEVDDTYYDWLLEWANQEFDFEALRQSLSGYVIADDDSKNTTKAPLEQQHQLFEDAADQPSAEVTDEHSS